MLSIIIKDIVVAIVIQEAELVGMEVGTTEATVISLMVSPAHQATEVTAIPLMMISPKYQNNGRCISYRTKLLIYFFILVHGITPKFIYHSKALFMLYKIQSNWK